MSTVLEELPDLRSLAIDKNGLQDGGAEHLIAALPSCTSLTLLSIAGNFFSVEKEEALRQAVAGNGAGGGTGGGGTVLVRTAVGGSFSVSSSPPSCQYP